MNVLWFETVNKIRLATVLAVLSAASAACCRARVQADAAPTRSVVAATPTKPAKSLPELLTSVLPEIKAKTHVPVMLPSDLPQPVSGAKHAVIEKASDKEYAIILLYKLGIGDAGFAAFFGAQGDPDYEPQDLGNIRKVELTRGLLGYFRPVSCGGSCAPASIWWKDVGLCIRSNWGFLLPFEKATRKKR
jgi:hypothetical protein